MTQSASLSAALTSDQRRVVMIAWGTYAAFYLGRLNLSPALTPIAEALDIGLGEVGLLGTVFFWSYATGQIINGQLGNHISPRRLILFGLLLIAAANILFSLQSTLLLMAILAGVNGFAQAAGWGPMLHILSVHLSTDQKQRLSLLFSMSFQVGAAISWGLAGLLLATGNWRTAFWVPGVMLIGIALLWHRSGLDATVSQSDGARFRLSDITQEIRRLLPLLVGSACVGFVYVGFLLWLPTLILTYDFLPDALSRAVTALVPLIGVPGMQLAGYLLARQANVLQTTRTFLFGLLVCLVLSYLIAPPAQGLFVVLAVMLASGLAGLMLGSVPMLLAVDGRVSSAGGLMTAVWSIAGGLAGTLVGSVAETAGWNAVFALWIGFTLAAVGALWVAGRLLHSTG
jgi:sugar phosphate permease